MTTSTRTAIAITAAYVVLAFWMLDFVDSGIEWSNVVHHGVFFLPVVILWGWWFYKQSGRK